MSKYNVLDIIYLMGHFVMGMSKAESVQSASILALRVSL